MSTTPTVAEFLASTEPDEDDYEEGTEFPAEVVDTGDPLESIAHSLRTIAASIGEQEPTVSAEAYDGLSQEHADLEDKHRALFELLADVEKIVAKSSSKLADSVRERIAAWRNPEPEQEASGDNSSSERPEQPAHDAPVEDWRAYVRAVRPAEFRPTTLDTMNRSQIRTYLGIEHGGQA